MGKIGLAEVCASLEVFVGALGGVYESSAWVASRGFGRYESLTSLFEALKACVDSASDEERLALLRAHPDLAGKAALAGKVTAESACEQASCGLGSLTAGELARFEALNERYRGKFGFPFIFAVRNASKRACLTAFARRVELELAVEREECLAQVHKIAWLRLASLVRAAPTGKLTCHVLDTARGTPASGMAVTLKRLDCEEDPTTGALPSEYFFVTNADGRLEGGPALAGDALTVGRYEWQFHVGEYFAAEGVPLAATPFLDVVPVARRRPPTDRFRDSTLGV